MKASAIAIAVMFSVLPAIAATAVMARDSERDLFGPTEEIREQAARAEAALLSPNAWLNGVKNFELAERDFTRGESPERIRKRLAKAGEGFLSARDTAEAAAAALATGLESRRAASRAEAARLAAGDWIEAEKTFNAAAQAFERGNLKAARKKNDEATEQFLHAELNAIRTLVLAETRQLIAEIRRQKLDEHVPQTLGRAEQLAKRADELIVENRHALDEPKSLAVRAAYEARRAFYIATLAERIDREAVTIETLLLDWGSSLESIAAAADIEPDLSAGPDATSARIIAILEELPGLRRDLADRDALIVDLEDEIRELDAALGGAVADRSSLIRRLEQQARVREQFRQVENLFTDSEAVVVREGNRLILRLVGLNFASNSADLGRDDEALLAKAQTAIDVFPQCDLIVEGHTDAQGNARRNLALSEERAQAVKTWITEVMRIPAFRITASGYGDTQPIASNKTDQGRARNRRIDLIIVPKDLEAGSPPAATTPPTL